MPKHSVPKLAGRRSADASRLARHGNLGIALPGGAIGRRLHTNPALMTTLRGLPHRHLTALLQTPDPAAATMAAPGKPDKPPPCA
ncbi:hypothetical protein [Nonomuraea sp. NPDC049709]|uniref:hypothetical protein n=1 Tax=Nonomuraea sp. NPDC049709 TaxID=3154736 RepID=UPI00343C26A5